MNTEYFNEEENDQLKEVFNVAMGNAASDLATLLNCFIDLEVPEVKIVEAENVVNTVLRGSAFSEKEKIITFKQNFYNQDDIEGEAMIFFNQVTRQNFSEILGLKNKMDSLQEIDFMMELSNLLVGACTNSISTQLALNKMSFIQPKLLTNDSTMQDIAYENFKRSHIKWDFLLLAKITFKLKSKSFKCDLLFFLSEKSIELIHRSILDLLKELE